MGTNYYLREKQPCEACGRDYEPLHIGKSSGGWCFSLHVDPESGINDLSDWEAKWAKPGAVIEDEYGDTISVDSMRDVILNRSWPSLTIDHPQEYLTRNHADLGPNGLLRHRIEPRLCIAHGDGTYDLCVGEFS